MGALLVGWRNATPSLFQQNSARFLGVRFAPGAPLRRGRQDRRSKQEAGAYQTGGLARRVKRFDKLLLSLIIGMGRRSPPDPGLHCKKHQRNTK
jgi:hypothetical protein